MEKYGSAEFRQDYNQICGVILREERQKRSISMESLASGLLSGAALRKMESGKLGWRMLVGNTLLQRMGIIPDYFEMVASSDELKRWRKREDICLLIPDSPGEAGQRLQEYRQEFQRREPVEEQFLLKIELILRLTEKNDHQKPADAAALLPLAKRAVSCTVLGDWEKGLDNLLLAPSELEAILLVGAAEMLCGRDAEAWRLQQEVRSYPDAHQWEERVAVQILPQAALLGGILAMRARDSRTAFKLGKEALELLRRNFSHCYLLPLLELLGRVPGQELEEEERAYLKQAEVFRNTFERIYRQFDYPGHRMWQGISVDNVEEAGVVLKMLRKFAGKSRAKAVYDEEYEVVTERQLEKIESGTHKPSFENYQRLIQQYGKREGWTTAMLETDSAEVLELRQQIASLIMLCQWKKVEWEMEKLRKKVNPEHPKVKQELLFLEALLICEKTGDRERCLEMLFDALHITAPALEDGDKKWWVYQREEAFIVGNIADNYRKSGNMEKALEWLEALRFSLEQQKGGTSIERRAYAILMGNYDNYLGERKWFEQAVKASEAAACNYLKKSQVTALARAYYRIAWNTYEIGVECPCQRDVLKQKWKEAFQISEAVAAFMYDEYLIKFLKDRRGKYLL